MHNWNVYPDFQQASAAAAEFIAERIVHSLQQYSTCHVILPGGNTPVTCLELLAKQPLEWSRVHWYPGDERCYPQGHAERNDTMLQQAFISKLGETHFHPIPAELGAEQAAQQYRQLINEVGRFDVAFLGMGEDGHTASLFPANAALQDPASVVVVYNSPKAPAERVSLGVTLLRKVAHKLVLASGVGKANVIQRIQAGESLPVNMIGDINWYLDEAAMPTDNDN